MKQISTLLGAIVAAVAASACCVLPAFLGVASAGTLGLGAALAPYRPYLIGLTLVLLGIGFLLTYRPVRRKCDATECNPQTRRPRFATALLWGITALTLAALSFPQIGVYRTAALASASLISEEKSPTISTRTAVFTIANLTCAECTLGIVSALKKLSGVQAANVDFRTQRATVRYDAARVSALQLRAAIESTGFSVKDSRYE